MGCIRGDGAGGVVIAVKAVPGASRDQIVGVLGDRLKVKVAAAPEGGKANAAICALLAERLDAAVGCVEILSGHSGAEKRVRVSSIGKDVAMARLGLAGK